MSIPLDDSEVISCVKSAIKHINNIPPYIYRTIENDKVKFHVNNQALAQYIRDTANYFFVKDNAYDQPMIYWYENGVYKSINDNMLKGYIKSYIYNDYRELYRSNIINEVFKDLTTDLKYISQESLNGNEDLINFQNGLYDIKNKRLLPHSPDVYTTIQLPCKWNENEKIHAPVFNDYLTTLTNNDSGARSLLLQFIGACISNIKGYRFKKALFMVGKGNTGKSQLKSLTERILGDSNCCSIELSDLEERFGTSALYNKRLSGSGDMGFISIKELKQFKMLTGGDSVFTEFKGKNAFKQVYKGFLWFCCNKLPKFSGDNGKWVYDRIMIINCLNVIPEEKQDTHLLDKMFEERNSIIKLALNELQLTIDNNYKFVISDEIQNNSIIYRKENNTVSNFIKDCCKPRDNYIDGCSCKKFYDVYVAYCKDNNNGYAKTKKEFEEDLMELTDSTKENIIKRTKSNNYYVPYTITLRTYKEYYNIYGYNEYFSSINE